MFWWVRNWGSSWLGEPSAPRSVEQVHPVAGLESPGQMHSHAWGLVGTQPRACFLSRWSQGLFTGPLQQGNQTSYRVAQAGSGCREQARVPRDRKCKLPVSYGTAQLLPDSAGPSFHRDHPGSREGTRPHPVTRGMLENLQLSSACPRTVENIQSAPSHFSLFALSTWTFLRKPFTFC